MLCYIDFRSGIVGIFSDIGISLLHRRIHQIFAIISLYGRYVAENMTLLTSLKDNNTDH